MTHDPEKVIQASLRGIGQITPRDGFEQRIFARLESESGKPHPQNFFTIQRLALTCTAAVLACAAIVTGSVQHSKQHMPLTAGVPLPASGSGLGAASGTHIATQPIIVPQHNRARSERKASAGRSTVSRDAHKPSGVAVPDPATPPKP